MAVKQWSKTVMHLLIATYARKLEEKGKYQVVAPDVIEKAIQEEEKIRFSSEVQDQLATVEKSWTEDLLDVIDRLQQQVCTNGTGDTETVSSRHAVSDCATSTPHWRKFNRAGRGWMYDT